MLSSTNAASPSRVSSTVVSLDAPEEPEVQITHEEEEHEDINSEFHREVYGPKPGEEGWNTFEARFEAGDSEDPHNWSPAHRWYLTALAGLLVLNA